MKWWCCVKPNKRGRVSALLGPLQHALVRMPIHDDHNYVEVTNSPTQYKKLGPSYGAEDLQRLQMLRPKLLLNVLEKHTFFATATQTPFVYAHVHTYKEGGAEMTFAITTAPKYKLAEAGRTFFLQPFCAVKLAKRNASIKLHNRWWSKKIAPEGEFPATIKA